MPRDGRLELRVTNELEETVFVDRLQLIAVTHPVGAAVYPAEGLTSPPFAPFGVYVAPGLRPPARAVDDGGHDVLDALRHVDWRFVGGFALEPVRGYAKPHTLTLDLADPSEGRSATSGGGRTLLVLTGWTDYAFSSDNVAAHQAGLALQPPSLQVRDAQGRWQTVVPEIGIPVGRPQSVVVDLTGRFLSASREVRIETTMRIHWDRAAVDTSGRAAYVSGRDLDAGRAGGAGLTLTRMDAIVADLAWRGFSAEGSPDGRQPLSHDYDRVSRETPWKLMPGRYTREGDVRDLLRETDDMFVVSRPGDEIPAGLRRDEGAGRAGGACADVPAVRPRLQQGDGPQFGEPGPGGAAPVSRDDPVSLLRAGALPRHPGPPGVPRHLQHPRCGACRGSARTCARWGFGWAVRGVGGGAAGSCPR